MLVSQKHFTLYAPIYIRQEFVQDGPEGVQKPIFLGPIGSVCRPWLHTNESRCLLLAVERQSCRMEGCGILVIFVRSLEVAW